MAKRKVISLFTGAGGLDLGLEAAGFETAVAVEMDRDSVRTLRHNRDWAVVNRDIHLVKSRELLETTGLRAGDAHLLVGGPPCQPFSKSAFWAHGEAGRLNDPRAKTLKAYMRVLRDLQPKAFLLENVAGLAYQGKNEGFDLLRRSIKSINRSKGTSYSFSVGVLNAGAYGAPQDRERLFVVGHRDGREFRFPEPTHTHPGELRGETQRVFTAWDAIGDLQDDDDESLHMTGKWAGLLPSIPEGCNYLHHTDRGDGLPLFGWRRRYWNFLLKLAKDIPAWTITAGPGSATGPFHWRNRRLSRQELCRLQTIPDSYEVIGDRVSWQRQIGNAVPSVLAEFLGRSIIKQLFRGRVPDGPLKLRPKRRRPVPEPEPIRVVAKKYRELVGAHEPHPGTGRGPGAVARHR